MSSLRTIGIIGAGKLGTVLAQLSTKAGYKVLISSASDPLEVSLSMSVLAPEAKVVSTNELVAEADVSILAIPLKNFRNLDPELFRGKLVIDAMNYWPEVDGNLDDIILSSSSQSEEVAEYFKESVVVKALNHMGYHHLFDEARTKDQAYRKSIAIAGDSETAVRQVAVYIDAIGFDPLVIGGLAKGRSLEIGQPAFGANLPRNELKKVIEPSD